MDPTKAEEEDSYGEDSTTYTTSVTGEHGEDSTTYTTLVTGEHGIEYQKEIFYYFCLQFFFWLNDTWKLGYEVSKYKPFDDITVFFKLDNKDYKYFIQAKHASSDNKVVTMEHICSTRSTKNNTEKKLQSNSTTTQNSSKSDTTVQNTNINIIRNFGITKYCEDSITKIIKKHDSEGTIVKLCLFTNYVTNIEEQNFNTGQDVADDTLREILNDLSTQYESLSKQSYKVVQFPEGLTFGPDNNKTVIEKDFLTHFAYIFRLPSLCELVTINNALLQKYFENFSTGSFYKVRNDVYNSVNIHKADADESVNSAELSKENSNATESNSNNKVRKYMTKKDFSDIIYDTIYVLHFPQISDEFLKQFPDWLEFSTETIKEIQKNKGVYICSGNAKLTTFMIYKAIYEQNGSGVLCLPYSKLTEIDKTSLEHDSKRAVVYIENLDTVKDSARNFDTYKNTTFVIQVTEEFDNEQKFQKIPRCCSYNDLSEDAKKVFGQGTEFQGINVPITEITENPEILTKILQTMFDDNHSLKLGKKLPHDLPKFYVERNFNNPKDKAISETVSREKVSKKKVSKEKPIPENEAFEVGKNTIIQGPAGVGKSTVMLRIAQSTKIKDPSRFVVFVDLKQHSKVFKELKDSKSPKTKENNSILQEFRWRGNRGDSVTSSGRDNDKEDIQAKALDIFQNHFIQFGSENEEDRKIEYLLFKAYLEEHRQKIIIFLDGFDEICPYYNDEVMQIIKGLKNMEIQIFLSSQPHFVPDQKDLGFDKVLILNSYEQKMQSEFLRSYWKNHLDNMIDRNEIQEDDVERQHIDLYVKKFIKMCYKSNLTEEIRSIPLLLNIIADIFTLDCMEFCKISNARWSQGFLHVSVLAIYERIFQEICKKFYKKTQENPDNVYILDKEPDIIEEVRQNYMDIAAENLLNVQTNRKIRRNEILGRGFVKEGNKEGSYIFIHETFEEYFAADWFSRKLFSDDAFDVRKFREFHNNTDIHKKVTKFLYRIMIVHLGSKEFEASKNIILREQPDTRALILDIIKKCLTYALFNRDFELFEKTFVEANLFCETDENNITEIREIIEKNKFLDRIPIVSPKHLRLIIEIHRTYFGDEKTNEVLRKRLEKILSENIIDENEFPLFEEFFKTIIERNILTENEFVKQTYAIFHKKVLNEKIQNWVFVKDMFLWYFSKLGKTQTDILREAIIILNEVESKFKTQRYFLGHIIAAFWESKMDPEFLENVYQVVDKDWSQVDWVLKNYQPESRHNIVTRKNHYRFIYALNSITRQDILEKAIEVMRQNGCSFIGLDGKSVLCHAFEDNNNYLVKRLLELFTNSEVMVQIDDEVCGGNSITKQCTMNNLNCQHFITYMLQSFGDFHTPMEDGQAEKFIKTSIEFLNTIFVHNIEVDKSALNNFVRRCRSNVKVFKDGKQIDLSQHFDKEAEKYEKVNKYISDWVTEYIKTA